MSNKVEYKVSGFRVNQQFLDDIRFVLHKTEDRLTVTSLTVFLTMLSELDDKNLSDGIIHDYSLSKWAEKLSINYQSLWNGYQLLLKNFFIEEVIIDGRSSILVRNYEDYNNPAKNKINYFKVPKLIFNTSILSKLVKTSCLAGLLFVLETLNRTRTKLGKDLKGGSTESEFIYTMGFLKERLNKRAVGVRHVLDILSEIFKIKANKTQIFSVNPKTRKKSHEQVWIHSYNISLKPEFYEEKQTENREVHQLMSLANKQMMHFFKKMNLTYSNQDKQDFVTVFRFEIIEKLRLISKYSGKKYDAVKESKKLLSALFENMEEKKGKIQIRTIGGFFRKSFSALLIAHLNNGFIDSNILIDATYNYYRENGSVPDWLHQLDNQYAA